MARQNRPRPSRSNQAGESSGGHYTGYAVERGLPDQPPATGVGQPPRTPDEPAAQRQWPKPTESFSIGRRVLVPYFRALRDARAQYRQVADEVGLQPKDLPPLFAFRYTTTWTPARGGATLAALEASREFQAEQEFHENHLAVRGLVAAEQTRTRVFVDYMVEGPAEAVDGLLSERELVRRFVNMDQGKHEDPLRIRLLQAQGEPSQLDEFMANTSDLIAETGAIAIELGRLGLVAIAK